MIPYCTADASSTWLEMYATVPTLLTRDRTHPRVLMGLYDSLTFVGCTRRTHSFRRVSTFSCSTECGKQNSPIRPSPNGSTRMVAEVGVLWRDFYDIHKRACAHTRTQNTHARTHTHIHTNARYAARLGHGFVNTYNNLML